MISLQQVNYSHTGLLKLCESAPYFGHGEGFTINFVPQHLSLLRHVLLSPGKDVTASGNTVETYNKGLVAFRTLLLTRLLFCFVCPFT